METLASLEAAVEAALDDDSMSEAEFERLTDRRDAAWKATYSGRSPSTTQRAKGLEDMLAEAQRRADAAKAAQAGDGLSPEQRREAEVTQRVAENEAAELAAAAPFIEMDDTEVARAQEEVLISVEDAQSELSTLKPGHVARKARLERERKEGFERAATLDVELTRRRRLREGDQLKAMYAHQQAMASLQTEDRQTLGRILNHSGLSSDEKEAAQKLYDETYRVRVNPKPGDDLPTHPNPERWAAALAAATERLDGLQAQAARDQAIFGRAAGAVMGR